MNERCDFCGREALELAYAPTPSPRGLSVWLCTHCALVQSLPRIDHVEIRTRAVSAGADWGNVRYGKGFRAETAAALIDRHAPANSPLAVLDVGANRGAFIAALRARRPDCTVTAIEPDPIALEGWTERPGVTLMRRRIEQTKLPSAGFDVVHSAHTLEHLAAPSVTLRDHWRVLKAGGLFYAEVPNLALIGASDLVEEWFIDKHLFHWTAKVFTQQVEAAGFRILVAPDPHDTLNVTLLAEKAVPIETAVRSNPREVEAVQDLIAAYKANRARSRAALGRVARHLESLATRRLAVWGAGRLFDALVSDAGFDTKAPIAVVDKHLACHGHCVRGRAVELPAVLGERKPGVIVVMSRAFADEICAEAKRLVPGAEILGYGDLLRAALTETAPMEHR